ncbi:MAG: PAS domain S-box protein [Chloroflexaceae bacterium]|nr:PAS domain S-box protein [Chloroflexaceae bacterium]
MTTDYFQADAPPHRADDELERQVVERTRNLLQTNAALQREIEEAYHALIDHSLQGLFIIQGQRIMFANAAMSTITGYSLEEMLTMPPEETQQWILPDDLLRMQEYLELCLMNPTVPLRYQYRIIRKDGELRWVESHATVIQYQGQPAIQAANIDITERKQAEEMLRTAYTDVQKMNERLRRGRNLLRAIFDNLSDGLLLLDQASVVQEVNRPLAALLGGTPEEMVGQPWGEVWDRQHATWGRDSQPVAILEDPLGHQGRQQRVSYRSPDGATQVLDIRAISLAGPDGRMEQLILHVVDVTEQVQLQSRMIQNERFAASGRLVASVAHEVNTPLQAILTALSLAQRSKTAADRRLFLSHAMDEVQRVAHIVRQLLDLYRPGMTMPGPVHLNVLIERSLLLTRQWFDERKVTIVHHLDKDIPTVRGYANELTQVLLNLLTNARDAMPSGGGAPDCDRGGPGRGSRGTLPLPCP